MQDLRSGDKGEEWDERIYCLSCNSLLVDEGETQPERADGVKADGATHDETASADEITVQGGDVKPVDVVPLTPNFKVSSLKETEAPVEKEDDGTKETTMNGGAASTSA